MAPRLILPPGLAQSIRLDANETMFLSRELEAIDAELARITRPEIVYPQVFPVDRSGGAGLVAQGYRQVEHFGKAKFGSGRGHDAPMADAAKSEFFAPVRIIEMGWSWSQVELERAARSGVPLDREKAMAAEFAVRRLLDETAFNGEADLGLDGIFRNADIPSAVVATGVGGVTWALKTNLERLADLNAVINSVYTVTNGVERADTVLLPLEQYTLIASTPLQTGSDTTVLQFFLRNNPFVTAVIPTFWCDAVALKSARDCIVAYRRSPEVLQFRLPRDFQVFPVQNAALEYKVNTLTDTAGMTIKKPKAIAIGEGI